MSLTPIATTSAGTVPGKSGLSISRSDILIIVGSAIGTAATGVTAVVHTPAIVEFVFAAVAVALLAALVGRCVDRIGDRLSAGATGVLQSALGNLPELFISFFALRKGLLAVVQSAIIGSILANLLLVLGIAFVAGGLRHGTQRFDASRVRSTCVLLALATVALVLPSLAKITGSPAARHTEALSIALAIVLLVVFALQMPASIRRTAGEGHASAAAAPEDGGAPDRHDSVTEKATGEGHWPLWFAIAMLAVAGVAAGLVSDWFVDALTPAMDALHISPVFAGLVIVAIAGNAIENVVGVQLALRNKAEYALSIIINSPLQIALVLAPLLVLVSLATATTLTLVFAPLLVVAVVVAVAITSLIVMDGESNWLEGVVLIGLYAMIATLFWWG